MSHREEHDNDAEDDNDDDDKDIRKNNQNDVQARKSAKAISDEQPSPSSERDAADQRSKSCEEDLSNQPRKSCEEDLSNQPRKACEEELSNQPRKSCVEDLSNQPRKSCEEELSNQPRKSCEANTDIQPRKLSEIDLANQTWEPPGETSRGQPSNSSEKDTAEQRSNTLEKDEADQYLADWSRKSSDRDSVHQPRNSSIRDSTEGTTDAEEAFRIEQHPDGDEESDSSDESIDWDRIRSQGAFVAVLRTRTSSSSVVSEQNENRLLRLRRSSFRLEYGEVVQDFRYYFCHPYLRMFVCISICFLNFLIFAEDPVAHSKKEASIPVLGNDIAFLLARYPPNALSLVKVLMWMAGLVTGCIFGKHIVHALLLRRLCRLEMFHNEQGAWMVMFWVTLLILNLFSWFYDVILFLGGDANDPYLISSLIGTTNRTFMRIAASGTWCGDFFTVVMVMDLMLQENEFYPDWMVSVRSWWQTGRHRILVFWFFLLGVYLNTILLINLDFIRWESLNRDLIVTSELSRAFLAASILVFDVTIVMQDWDFPHFVGGIDVKLPGLNKSMMTLQIPNFAHTKFWEVTITGIWFNYGILTMVILLDLNMMKNQMLYTPFVYGQYTAPDGKIYVVEDMKSLVTFNESLLTFAYRNSTINADTNRTYIEGDTSMTAHYMGYSMWTKATTFFPTLAIFALLAVKISVYGRFQPATPEQRRDRRITCLYTRSATSSTSRFPKPKFGLNLHIPGLRFATPSGSRLAL